MIDEVLLTSICRPKQWKTISTKDLQESGFPIYGANGKIGFYHTYTHEYPTVLITCRGATCGSINISEPKSYVNGNAMALDNLSSNVDMYYLKHYLEYRKLDDVISGTAQPQITGQGLSKVKIPLPPLPQQQKIANILDAADELRQNDKKLIAKYDELTQSLFLDMFGDPWLNPKKWPIYLVEDLAKNEKNSIKAGPFGSSLKKEFYKEKGYKIYGQEQVIKDDFSYGNYYIDEAKYKSLENCKIKAGDILISLVGTYGKISVVPEKYEPGIINPRLMKITPNKNIIRPDFLKILLQGSGSDIQMKSKSRGGTMDIVNVGIMRKIRLPVPPINLQNQFAERFALIEEQKAIAQKGLEKSEALFNSLLQKAFKGEL